MSHARSLRKIAPVASIQFPLDGPGPQVRCPPPSRPTEAWRHVACSSGLYGDVVAWYQGGAVACAKFGTKAHATKVVRRLDGHIVRGCFVRVRR